LPRRVSPKYYDEGPYFFGPDSETDEEQEGPARDEYGRFTYAGTKVKDPSATIYPPRPRSHRVSYSSREQILRIQFRNGRVYGYYDVPPTVWRSLRGAPSTGRFINRRLDPFYEYGEEYPVDI
jgi:hypothetical protein